MAKLKSLSLCFPAYNEETVIAKTVEKATLAGRQFAERFEIIIVDDGSKDKTGEILDKLARKNRHLKVIYHHPNKGYGAAVTTALNSATMDWVFFSDSDLQFDLLEIEKFLKFTDDYDAIIGYRAKRQDPLIRILNAKMWGLLNRLLFGLKVKDIDCAFKLFKRKVVKNLKLTSSGAMVSAEMLIRIFDWGYKVKEVPVTHLPSPEKTHGTTGAKPAVIFRAFKELFKFLPRRQASKKSYSQNRKNLIKYLLYSTYFLIAVGIIIRILYLPIIGFAGDFGFFKYWDSSLQEVGFRHFYQIVPCNYLPVYVYSLEFSHLIRPLIRILSSNGWSNDQIFWISYKIPYLIFDILTGLLIYKIVAAKFKDILRPALAMMFYLLCPPLFHWAYLFGQNNVFLYFPILLTLYGILNKKTYLGGLGLALLLLFKPTGVILAPFIGLLSILVFKKDFKKYLRFYLTAAIIIQVVILPFEGMRNLWDYARTIGYFLTAGNGFKVTEIAANNFWFIISKGESISDSIKFMGISYYSWGLALFSFFYAIILWLLYWKKGKNVFLLATIIFFLFFNLPTRVHDGYLTFAFPIFIVALFLEWSYFLFFVYIVSIIAYTFNLWFVWPYKYQVILGSLDAVNKYKTLSGYYLAYILTLTPLVLICYYIYLNRKNIDCHDH